MGDVWVVNASPIITLAKIGQLQLLEKLSERLIVPQAVAAEIVAGPANDPAAVSLRGGWGARENPGHVPESLIEWGLGAGETAVLAIANQNTGFVAVLDDASARAAARIFRVPVIGTLGVILMAKRVGLISSAAEAMRQLQSAGLFVDMRVIRKILEAVGETWDS